MTVLLLVAGLGLLVAGAELLVRGASRLAVIAGISPVVVGLTVVAYGTSAPEVAVSIDAGLSRQADIALGNAVGSNIFNILVVLGASALAAPLAVSRQLVRLDVPVMIGVTALAWLMAADGAISRAEGLVLLAGAAVYTVMLVRIGRRRPASGGRSRDAKAAPGLARSLVFVLLGLALLVLGARWLVGGAAGLARALGVSEMLVGLTIVAAGTSLPEAATSIVASLRGEREIAVANAVGSCTFNIFVVLGSAAAISGGLGVSPVALRFDIPVMMATAVFCFPLVFSGGRITRGEGALLVGWYLAYTALLVLAARHSGEYTTGPVALWGFAAPMAAVGAALIIWHLRAKRRAAGEPRLKEGRGTRDG